MSAAVPRLWVRRSAICSALLEQQRTEQQLGAAASSPASDVPRACLRRRNAVHALPGAEILGRGTTSAGGEQPRRVWARRNALIAPPVFDALERLEGWTSSGGESDASSDSSGHNSDAAKNECSNNNAGDVGEEGRPSTNVGCHKASENDDDNGKRFGSSDAARSFFCCARSSGAAGEGPEPPAGPRLSARRNAVVTVTATVGGSGSAEGAEADAEAEETEPEGWGSTQGTASTAVVLLGAAAPETRDAVPAAAAAEDAGERGPLGRAFDALSLSPADQVEAVCAAAEATGVLARLGLSPARWRDFVADAQRGYGRSSVWPKTRAELADAWQAPPPFHSFAHAADTVQCAARLLRLTAGAGLDDERQLAVLVATLCHDLDHPGLTNGFLSEVEAEVAVLYSDRSPLESHHAACASRLLLGPSGSALLADLSVASRRAMRRTVCDAILRTDMARHGEHLKVSAGDGGSAVVALLVHVADLAANVTRPRDVALRWSLRLVQEFHRQGELERLVGVPCSPMTEGGRHASAVEAAAALTLPFVERCVVPLLESSVSVLPGLVTVLSDAREALCAWKAVVSPRA